MRRSQVVILVHGLWLHGLTMAYMKRAIARCGYAVHPYSYPSVRLTLDENAARLARYCRAQRGDKLHFVAHSMGGLVALEAARALPRERVGRLVFLGTPYGGCYAGRCLLRFPLGRSILGRCMGQCLEAPRPGGDGGIEIGVIAGTHRIGLGRFFAPDLPKPNDGVVSVEETRVPGMRDHLVLPVSHTVMLVAPEVARQVCAFLEYGQFARTEPAEPEVN